MEKIAKEVLSIELLKKYGKTVEIKTVKIDGAVVTQVVGK